MMILAKSYLQKSNSSISNKPKRARGVSILLNSSSEMIRCNLTAKADLEVEIGYGHSWENIEIEIRELVDQEDLALIHQLWSDDDCQRSYQRTAEGLRITFLENELNLKNA